MNTKLVLCFFVIAGFCSCSTAYRSGQTPDDVYYSPVPPHNDYVRQDNTEDKDVYTSSTDDVLIRSRIHNRRWRRYDNYGYDYYYYDYRYPLYVDPKYNNNRPNNYIQPRKFNLGGYKPAGNADNAKVTDIKSGKSNNNGNAPIRTFKTDNSNTNNNNGVGNFIRKVFSGGSNNSNSSTNNTYKSNNNTSTDNTPTRTFDNSRSTNNSSNNNSSNNNTNSSSNSGSSNSGSSGSSGGNAPVRTFPK